METYGLFKTYVATVGKVHKNPKLSFIYILVANPCDAWENFS